MTDDANQPAPEKGKAPDHFLAQWREYRGLSQERLGEMAHVSHSTISRVESGATALKTGFLRKLAKILRTSVVAILTVNPLGEGRQTAEMLDVWNEISPRKRRDAIRLMKALAASDAEDDKG